MPTHVGPNISGEENLVFGYDLSDQKNSYLGEPTTNLANNTPLFGGWPGSYTLIDSATKTFDFTTSSVEWGGAAAWTTFYYNVSEYTGQYVTISAVVESFDETSGVFSFMWIGQTVDEQTYLGYSPEQDRNTKNTKTRERISWSGVIGTGGKVGILIWMNNGSGGPSGSIKVRFSNLQVEVKSHPTPFVNGTRSTTQGLLDLTKNNTINISGTSFNSTAQMTFDGTNDIISIPTNSIFNTNIFSVESVFKLSTYDNEHRTIASRNASVYSHSNGWWMGTLRNGLGNGNNDFRMFFWGDSSYVTYSTSNGGNDGRHHHMVISSNGITVFFYVDGQLIYSASKPSGNLYSSSENILIGQSPVGDNWSGEIPVVKFYNRELSSSEVLNNYNNIKRKYGI
jgi:hypothetical protein